MKLNLSGRELYRSFNLVSGIISATSVKQVLQGVRIEAKGHFLELVATDLEVLVRCRLSLKDVMEENDGLVVPAARVNSILREWVNEENVSIVTESGNCVLRARGSYFKVVGENIADFPVVCISKVNDFVEIGGEIIGSMVGKVIHAVSQVKARGPLCGVFVRVKGDDLIMVAADGNRMSYVKRKIVNTSGTAAEGILTVKSLSFLQKFVSEYGGVIKIGLSDSQAQFIGENGEVISQLIEGQFPRYEDVIPTGSKEKVEINVGELVSKVRMTSHMTIEGYRVVRFLFKSGKLVIMSKTAEVGESEVEIPVLYSGQDIEMNFNPDYILDALKTADGETVTMEFNDNSSAVLFRTGHEQFSVIMPIELKQGIH